MKKFIPILLCSLSTISGAIFDQEKCLPPVDGDQNLFPQCKEWFGNVEFLFWKVNEGALDYAIQKQKCCSKVIRSKFDSNPGVRVAVGYYNAPKYWELFGQYTYFQTYGRDRTCDSKADLNGTFQLYNQNVVAATTTLKLNYQIADVMFSRVFDPNPHLRMRLLAGISGAFIDQKWSVDYLDDREIHSDALNKWKYNAGGLRVGLAADWWWKWHLYFTGKVSLAGFAGKYTNQATNNPDLQNLCYSDYRYVQHLQLLLGPSWHCVAKCYHTEFFIGYELNGWLNLQEVYRTNPGYNQLFQNTSAVALQGLTMRATFGF